MEPTQACSPQDEVPHALAFTVTFGNPKTTKNAFTKRHNRNLSLPVVKVYENNTTPPVNGNAKKAGNHSDGYFSSDPDDESNSKPKLSEDESIKEKPSPVDNEEGSDVGSDTGTYTIDKEPPEVITARLSIDANFGIDPSTNTPRDSTAWISEWASNTVNHANSFKGSNSSLIGAPVSRAKMGISKIPSPVTTRARLGSKSSGVTNASTSLSKGDHLAHNKNEINDNSYETESYLKTTEKHLSAIAARMSASLDSGGESDADSKGSRKGIQRSDSSASESGPKTASSATRFNRTFNMRRGRESEQKKTENLSKSKPEAPRSASSVRSKATTPVLPPTSLSRNDLSRVSLRTKSSSHTPILTNAKSEIGIKKKPTSGNGGGRSNSTLSSKEVDFQNWKRRKSYDPMKAAAEGKKKEAAKKPPPSAMTASTSNAVTTPKSPVSSVLRSASFHGTRHLAGRSSSEEDEEMTLSAEDEDWPVLQAPKTSLENTPRGSRVSLFSNNSNSPRAKHKLEGVDNLVVSAISGLSNKLKLSAGTLLKKLRYLYDEESEKYQVLTTELEQLEVVEGAGSPQKSSSKELALSLKNLKKLDMTLKVLDEVLFDDVDYE